LIFEMVSSLILTLTLFPGSSIPSAVVLWVMRELPPAEAADVVEESSTIAFVPNSSVVVHHPQRWTTATSVQNQVPISHISSFG
jgi:hypothetical protein